MFLPFQAADPVRRLFCARAKRPEVKPLHPPFRLTSVSAAQ